jgi:hypothetical protein
MRPLGSLSGRVLLRAYGALINIAYNEHQHCSKWSNPAILALFTQVPRRGVLGSPHSPGPTPMSVPGSDRLPEGIIRTSLVLRDVGDARALRLSDTKGAIATGQEADALLPPLH